ncbi:MAG: ATP-binding cassette domain-containing protein [Planctomycetes bacterium]|nr:ATP-binding cassette domain-containing protein [Planctomycetota bacterium]
MLTVTGVCLALMPLPFKYIIDTAIPEKSMSLVIATAGIFLLAMAMRIIFFYIAWGWLVWISEDVVFRIRQMGFRHIQGLCLRFHSANPSGSLYNRVFEKSINDMALFFRQSFPLMMCYGIGLVVSVAACLWLSPPMTGVILIGSVGYVAIARYVGKIMWQKKADALSSHNIIAGFIMDRLRGVKTIQAFAMEDRVQEEFDGSVWPMQVKYVHAALAARKLSLGTEYLSYAVRSAVWIVGAYIVMGWDMKVGVLVAFVQYQTQLTHIMSHASNMYGQFSAARAGFDQVQTLMDIDSSVKDHPEATMPDRVEGRLDFDDVTFRYEDEDVLQDVSFKAEPGKMIALVGPSGSGKSTIANLLLRFYDPQGGRVELDGRDIRELPLRQYRGLFGVVLQDPFLFNCSIAENLRYAQPDATDQEVRQALNQARALDFVKDMRHGIHTKIGEFGGKLSGGQRQRIAIARCMLQNPRFMILDEATAALDNESEEAIQRSLDDLFEGRTSFVIAHRLSTIRGADRILVVDQGRIVEDGSYKELVRQKGLFYKLHTIATSTSTRQIKLSDAGFA